MSAPHTIQDAIKAYLATVPWFASPTAISVFTQDEGDLEGKIAAALGPMTSKGLALLVTVPQGDNQDSHSAAVVVNTEISVQCIEAPLVSQGAGGVDKTAYEAARRIAAPYRSASAGLHGWRSGVSGCGELHFQRYRSDSDPESGSLIYSVTFGFKETLD